MSVGKRIRDSASEPGFHLPGPDSRPERSHFFFVRRRMNSSKHLAHHCPSQTGIQLLTYPPEGKLIPFPRERHCARRTKSFAFRGGPAFQAGPRVPVNKIASIAAHLPDARVSEPVGARRKFDNASAAAGNVYCAIMHYHSEGVARGFETRTAEQPTPLARLAFVPA